MIILYTFLAIFFFAYIANITKNAFKHEVESGIDKALLNTNTEDIKKLIKAFNFDKFIDFSKLKEIYSKPNDDTTHKNNNLLALITVIGGFLWLIFFLSVLVIKTFNVDVNIAHIIKENLFVFLFIGVLEFLFFKYIASKYIPVEPEYMIETLKDYVSSKFE